MPTRAPDPRVGALGADATDVPAAPEVPEDVDTLAEPVGAALSALWQQYKSEGAATAREQLILHYSPLVKYVAGRVGVGLPATVESADLVSYGLFGLIDAIEKFDLARGLRFETYAISRIRGSIIDELRGLDLVPRSVRALARQVEQAAVELSGELRRAPTDDEVAARAGVAPEEVRSMYATLSMTNVAALDEMVRGHDDGATLGDLVVDDRVVAPDEAVEGQALRDILLRAIDVLPQREQIIVALYYYEGFTLAEIGEVLGITESRVSQMHSKAMMLMRGRLADVTA